MVNYKVRNGTKEEEQSDQRRGNPNKNIRNELSELKKIAED